MEKFLLKINEKIDIIHNLIPKRVKIFVKRVFLSLIAYVICFILGLMCINTSILLGLFFLFLLPVIIILVIIYATDE
jgi:hypothetical protein